MHDIRRSPVETARRTTTRQAFLMAVSGALRSRCSPRRIGNGACALLRRHLSVDQVDYHETETTALTAHWRGGSGQSFPEGRAPLMAERLPAAQREAYRAGRAWRSEGEDGACGALLGIPLLQQGEIAAVMTLRHGGPRAWSDEDVEVAAATLERCRAAAQRAHAEHLVRGNEEQRAFLLELSDVLRSLSDPDAVLQEAMRALGRHLGANRAHYLEVRPDQTLRPGPTYLAGTSDVPPVLDIRRMGMLFDRYRRGESVAIADAAYYGDECCPERERFRALGIGALLGVPLMRGGELVALIGIHQNEPRAWTRAEITLVQEVAERAWSAAERARAQAALQDSERRLQTLVAGVPQLVWRAEGDGAWTWASPQWATFTGQSEADAHAFGWLACVHPEDRAAIAAGWAVAARAGQFRVDFRICHDHSTRYRWFQGRAMPVRADDGTIVEWLGTCTDIDDMHRLQVRQELLVAELQHRVRNILTVVRSVFTRTIETGDDITDVAQHFQGRLDALARTQVIVTRNAEQTVDLEDLIREELLSVAVGDGPQVEIAGPEVKLSGRIAEMLGLAIHELTTNALKYGALKVPAGRLRIDWEVNPGDDETPALTLRWTEDGVPVLGVHPRREGFGRELIEQALPYRLGAETRLAFEGGGLRCVMTLPLVADANPSGDEDDLL